MQLNLKITRAEAINVLKKFGFVILGTLALAFGCAIFTIPFDLVTGGVTGIAIIINQYTADFISIDVIIAILTWSLFFLGLIVLGRDFAMKTLVSSIIYPIGITLFTKLLSEDVLGGFFFLQNSAYSEIAILIGSIFGGLMIGLGAALTFIGGGSTGGVDIIAFVLCKIFKKWKSSVTIFAIDATTVILGMFVLQDMVRTLLGIISASIAAIVIDRVFLGRSRAFTAEIVSDHYDEIRKYIIEDIHRTSTIVDAKGGYSGADKKMIFVTFDIRQYADLINVINKVDKHAFVSIHSAHEINGEGWTYGHHESDFVKK